KPNKRFTFCHLTWRLPSKEFWYSNFFYSSAGIKENHFTSMAFLLNPLQIYESVTEPNLAFYGLIAHRAMSHGFA
ncbi:TPA: hypothetical protein ACIZB6_005948, partial [Klebsiella pneumoniae]